MKRFAALLLFAPLVACARPVPAPPTPDAAPDPGLAVVATIYGRPIQQQDLDPDPQLLARQESSLDSSAFAAWLGRARGEHLHALVLADLEDAFCRDLEIDVTDTEIDEFLGRSRASWNSANRALIAEYRAALAALKSRRLSRRERARLQSRVLILNDVIAAQAEMEERPATPDSAAQRQIASATLRQWKINRVLFARYGGRVAVREGIPVPADARRRFLEEHERAGSFVIIDTDMRSGFWYASDSGTPFRFVAPESTAICMERPWWLSPGAREEGETR